MIVRPQLNNYRIETEEVVLTVTGVLWAAISKEFYEKLEMSQIPDVPGYGKLVGS